MSLVTREDLAERRKVQKLKPTEADFKGRKGYWRRYKRDENGNRTEHYEWGFRYKPNEHGKLTPEGAEVQARMMPFIRADVERHARMPAKSKEVLRDADGSLHYVDPGKARDVSAVNGWLPHCRPRGAAVERGPDGMLFRRGPHGWDPLGVRCLGKPLRRLPALVSPQRDPDFGMWWRRGRKWMRGDDGRG